MSALTLEEAIEHLEGLLNHEVLVIVESPGRGGVPVRLAGRLRGLGKLQTDVPSQMTGQAFTVGDSGLLTISPRTFMSAEIGAGGKLLRIMDLGGVVIAIERHDDA